MPSYSRVLHQTAHTVESVNLSARKLASELPSPKLFATTDKHVPHEEWVYVVIKKLQFLDKHPKFTD